MTELESSKRIFNITHWDADGLASTIVLKNFYNIVDFVSCSYGKLDEQLDKMSSDRQRMSNYDLIYITDLNFTPEQLNKVISLGIPFVYLDHHDSKIENIHNPDLNRIVETSICGALLTQTYLTMKFGVDLSHLDYFLYLVNDYDMWHHKDVLSKPFNYVFEMYSNNSQLYVDVFKNGLKSFDDLGQREQEFIFKKINELNTVWDKLQIYDISNFSVLINVDNKYINEMADRIFAEYKEVGMVFNSSPHGRSSVRVRQEVPENCSVGNIIAKTNMGGGHAKAAGITFPSDMSKVERLSYFQYIDEQMLKLIQATFKNK